MVDGRVGCGQLARVFELSNRLLTTISNSARHATCSHASAPIPCSPRTPSAANNWLTGTTPPELSNLRKLRQLELGTNFLQGSIGPWIGTLQNLEILNLGANGGINPPQEEGGDELPGLIGPIPQSLEKLTRLMELDLQVGQFEGRWVARA